MKTVAELEARIKELEDAIEWTLDDSQLIGMGRQTFTTELRARAFPPQFEEVTEHRKICLRCQHSYRPEEHRDRCCQEELVEFSRTYKRPIPTKVKRREEVVIKHDGKVEYLNTKDTEPCVYRQFFAEWESKP